MCAGNGMVLNANEFESFVTHTPMDVANEPLGIVRPLTSKPYKHKRASYGGGSSGPSPYAFSHRL